GTTTLRSREGNPLLRHLGPARVRHACVRPTGTARVRPHGDRARPPPRGPRTSMPKHGPRSPHLGSCLLTSNAPARSAAAAVAGSAWWSRWHAPGVLQTLGRFPLSAHSNKGRSVPRETRRNSARDSNGTQVSGRTNIRTLHTPWVVGRAFGRRRTTRPPMAGDRSRSPTT